MGPQEGTAPEKSCVTQGFRAVQTQGEGLNV